jgi:hypothetical protein
MGVQEGRGQLNKALKELMLRWAETQSSWNDAMSRQFEEKFLRQLELDLRHATGAMDQMAVILHQIHRDCE